MGAFYIVCSTGLPGSLPKKTTIESVCGSVQTLPWLPFWFLLLWGPRVRATAFRPDVVCTEVSISYSFHMAQAFGIFLTISKCENHFDRCADSGCGTCSSRSLRHRARCSRSRAAQGPPRAPRDFVFKIFRGVFPTWWVPEIPGASRGSHIKTRAGEQAGAVGTRDQKTPAGIPRPCHLTVRPRSVLPRWSGFLRFGSLCRLGIQGFWVFD